MIDSAVWNCRTSLHMRTRTCVCGPVPCVTIGVQCHDRLLVDPFHLWVGECRVLWGWLGGGGSGFCLVCGLPHGGGGGGWNAWPPAHGGNVPRPWRPFPCQPWHRLHVLSLTGREFQRALSTTSDVGGRSRSGVGPRPPHDAALMPCMFRREGLRGRRRGKATPPIFPHFCIPSCRPHFLARFSCRSCPARRHQHFFGALQRSHSLRAGALRSRPQGTGRGGGISWENVVFKEDEIFPSRNPGGFGSAVCA